MAENNEPKEITRLYPGWAFHALPLLGIAFGLFFFNLIATLTPAANSDPEFAFGAGFFFSLFGLAFVIPAVGTLLIRDSYFLEIKNQRCLVFHRGGHRLLLPFSAIGTITAHDLPITPILGQIFSIGYRVSTIPEVNAELHLYSFGFPQINNFLVTQVQPFLSLPTEIKPALAGEEGKAGITHSPFFWGLWILLVAAFNGALFYYNQAATRHTGTKPFQIIADFPTLTPPIFN